MDPDDNNDGNPDTSDPAPLNPNIPAASSDPPEQPSDPSNPPENEPGEVTPEVLQGISEIASRYDNLECVKFASAAEAYLTELGIHGRRIKLDTTKQVREDDYIMDDSFSESEAISINGHHEGIAITWQRCGRFPPALKLTINGEEKVFDNNHSDGVPTQQWKNNLTFFSKEFSGASFRESGYQF